ncbi:MAG: hypothetical protein AAB533_02290 [Patescibacteria group bacterium]
MFSIDLLPASEKKAVRLEEARRMTAFFALATLGIFGVALVLLIPALLLTRLGAEELARSLALEEAALHRGEAGEAIARMRDVRSVIGEIGAYGAQAPRASALVERFLAPGSGIRVRSFIVRRDGQAMIAGYAATRADLLRFEEALRASSYFYEITFPLSNITRERDVQFAVQGKLKQEYGL